jgi:hypothetical protein
MLDNKNIWLQMRNCTFWLLVILQIIPFFAVGVFFFFLDFLMIDKTDEF